MMTNATLAAQRCANQLLAQPLYATPEAVVAWLGAVQAQDDRASRT